MSERLIPFDFEAFKADPSRLRQVGGTDGPPQWAEPVRGNVVVMWQMTTTPLVYWGSQFSAYLRLAAKTRIVRVRLYRNDKGNVYALTDMGFPPLDTPTCTNGWPWCSDIIEITVTA